MPYLRGGTPLFDRDDLLGKEQSGEYGWSCLGRCWSREFNSFPTSPLPPTSSLDSRTSVVGSSSLFEEISFEGQGARSFMETVTSRPFWCRTFAYWGFALITSTSSTRESPELLRTNRLDKLLSQGGSATKEWILRRPIFAENQKNAREGSCLSKCKVEI